jgi:hypothetical protein
MEEKPHDVLSRIEKKADAASNELEEIKRKVSVDQDVFLSDQYPQENHPSPPPDLASGG